MFASKIQVFQILPKPSKLYELETYWNGAQIVDIAGDLNSCILATCSRAQGQVKVIELGSAKGKHRPYTNIIAAHTSHLVCIAVSPNGTYIATASRTGTLIRIFGARTGILHHELRRGADNATIYSLAFDRDSERLCAVSDTGTLHVFLLTVGTHNADTANRQSAFNPVQTVLPKYFSSDWSFAFMSLPKPTKSLVRFSNSDPAYIYAACADGGLYKFHYDLVNGKQGSLVSFRRFDIDADGL